MTVHAHPHRRRHACPALMLRAEARQVRQPTITAVAASSAACHLMQSVAACQSRAFRNQDITIFGTLRSGGSSKTGGWVGEPGEEARVGTPYT